MPNYEPLDTQKHADLKVDPTVFLNPARGYKTCPIVKSEAFSAAGSFPLFALKNPDTGQLVLSALFTLISDENLFCAKGDWDSPYIPINVRRYPFGVAMGADGQSAGEILIDHDATTSDSINVQAVFEPNGEPTAFLRAHQKSLGLLASEQEPTLKTIDRFSKAELITGLEIELVFSQSTHKVKNLYGINPAKFSALSGAQFEQMAKTGDLSVLLAMHASFAQISRLVWMENRLRTEQIQSFSITPS